MCIRDRVGTTSVRSVETAALSAEENGNPDLIEPYFSDTSIFIYPGKSFRVVDALITNFHLPESTLIDVYKRQVSNC